MKRNDGDLNKGLFKFQYKTMSVYTHLYVTAIRYMLYLLVYIDLSIFGKLHPSGVATLSDESHKIYWKCSIYTMIMYIIMAQNCLEFSEFLAKCSP